MSTTLEECTAAIVRRDEALAALIREVQNRIFDYQNPGSYLDDDYYIRCDAKADILEEVLSSLLDLQKGVS